MKTTHEQIKHITGMTDYDMFKTVFETGMAYLGYETFYHDEYMSAIAQTPEYWQFWQEVVTSRNHLFVKQFGDSLLSRKELCYIYEALLDVRSLSIYPPDYNWVGGYNDCIFKLIYNYKKTKSLCR